MATPAELSTFLVTVERRAFKQTLYAVRDDHAALDIVQDSMMKLATKYGAHPAVELPPLFQRILQNTMRDYWRRQKVRNLWTSLLSSFSGNSEDGEERDPLEMIDVQDDSKEPSVQLQRSQTLKLIEHALKMLPARQREAFVLRYWEEMSVADTAISMGCSEGSVKTHCSRAVHALATTLKNQGLDKAAVLNTAFTNNSSNSEDTSNDNR
jgi:RNA polymerase sigma-70 factor (ECF subfamily)